MLQALRPDSTAVPEVGGVLGGRNDLIQFFYNKRKIVFEIFASASQAAQDLRLLERCEADVRVAILLDEQVDGRVAKEYLRKKPDFFPYLWVSDLLRPKWERITLARLAEIVDEDSAMATLRRIMASPQGKDIAMMLGARLREVEAKLPRQPRTDARPPLTGKQILAIQVCARIKDRYGLPIERLRSLYAWLENAIEHAVTVISCGFAAFLVTNLDDYNAIWSAGDVGDFLLTGAGEADPRIVMSLTELINDFLEKEGIGRAPLRFHHLSIYPELQTLSVAKGVEGVEGADE